LDGALHKRVSLLAIFIFCVVRRVWGSAEQCEKPLQLYSDQRKGKHYLFSWLPAQYDFRLLSLQFSRSFSPNGLVLFTIRCVL